MAADYDVRVVGLRDFQAELRKIDKQMPRQLRVVNLKAAELVASDARSRASAQGGAIGKAAPSIKAVAQQRSAAVKIGGDKYPFALGGEFGSITYRQFPAWRGSGAGAGYALYPAKRAKTGDVIELYGDLMDDLAKRAFPK